MGEYAQALMYPVKTHAGVKMPTLLGVDDRSSSIKSSASYPIYSDANGNAAAFLVGHPNGVYLSEDNAGTGRGLDYSATPYTLPAGGYLVNPDDAQAFAQNYAEILGLFAASSSVRIAAFGADFQLSSAVLNQSGNCAVRIDYARRFAPGGSGALGFPVFQQEDVISYQNAVNGQDTVALPATSGFEVYAIPVSGAEDWHSTRSTGYGNLVTSGPLTGYGLSSTDQEQTIQLSLYTNGSVTDAEFERMLQSSYGAWSTIMICWVGLPPGIQVGTLNVAMHMEVIPKSKGVDYSQPKSYPHPQSMDGATLIARSSPKVRWGEMLRRGAGAAINLGKGMLKQYNPELYSAAANVANFLLGKSFNLGSGPQVNNRLGGTL